MNNLRKKKGKLNIIACLVILVILVFVFVTFYSCKNYMNTPASKQSKEIEFRVKKGANSSTIIEGLSNNGLLKNKIFAKIYVKKLNIDKKLKPGIYKLNTKMTPDEIFKKLSLGNPDEDVITITFPEGYNIKQIAKKLKEAGLIKDEEAFINEAQKGKFEHEFIADIPKDRPSRLEGYLFPDTYEFKKGISEHDIIKKMLDRFDYLYKNSIKEALKSTGLKLDKVIIMASIVEREARVSEERPIIAAVFYNRLKVPMRLQSCATIQYALGENRERLYNKDLEIDSPYNTYRHDGLPIGPICSPGESSIMASLNPSEVDYLYFVLKSYNGDGSHHFTKSFNEFERYKAQLK